MKILVIICSHEFYKNTSQNIRILKDLFDKISDATVHYCGITNSNEFHNYEDILTFKYKVVNPKRQLSKVCDFISDFKEELLEYDWFIKTRPDVKIKEMFYFSGLDINAINARARVYRGPKKIMYGMSVNGEGGWKHIGDCFYDEYEKDIIMDDQIYIFHNTLVQSGKFDKLCEKETGDEAQHEWFHTRIWKEREIPLNIIGINLVFTKYENECHSGNLNC
jgi:hypothetical protein